jgi:AsmA protein
MNRALKITAAIVGIVLALFAILVIAITLLVDPNDYRGDVEDAVRDATGRELRIDDDLSLSFFPWLGVETGRVALGNAEGFEGDFFSLQSADVRLRLLPLLRRQVEVAEIRVDGLRLNLAVNAEGVSNWDDLAPDVDEEAELPETEAEPFDPSDLDNLRIGGLRIRDAALSWHDDSSGLHAEIIDWSLRLGEIRWGEPLDFRTGLDFRLNEPDMSGRFEGEGVLQALLGEENLVRLNDLTLRLDLQGDELRVSPLALRLNWPELLLDLDADTLAIESFTGRVADMPLSGRLSVQALSGDPRVEFGLESGDFPATALAPFLGDEAPDDLNLAGLGDIAWHLGGQLDMAADELVLADAWLRFADTVLAFPARITALSSEQPEIETNLRLDEFSPRRLLTDVGLAESFLPETRDPSVLERFSLMGRVSMVGDSIQLPELDIHLDDSRIQGALGLPSFEPLAVRFDLAIDAIDLDRYLAPDDEAEVIEDDEPLDLDAIEIPAGAIRGQDVEGRFRIDRLQLAGMTLESVDTGLRIADDRLRLAPIDARLYGGEQRGSLEVDASGEVPTIRFTEQLSGVRIGGLLDDLFAVDSFTGLANIQMELSGSGRTVGELRPTLSGNMRLLFDDGAVEGVDVAHAFSQATSRFRADGAVRSDRGRTPFSTLRASGTVDEGRLTSEDFGLNIDGLRMSGAGWLSLVDLSMDYRLSARMQEDAGENMGSDEFNMQGRALSLRMTGTPMSPRFSFDTDGLLRQLRQERTGEAEARAREEAQEAERRAREREERARQEAREAEERAKEEARREKEEAERRLRERLRERRGG